jgi:murein DD-endopeptidase MepM/ murein hydrolase activator NlpD
MLALLLALPAQAARVRVSAPEKADIGQPFYFVLRASEPLSDVSVTWRGQKFSFVPHDDCVRTLLGVPNSAKHVGQSFPLTVEFTLGGKPRKIVRKVKAAPHSYPRQVLKVAPKMVNPPKSEQARIAAERKLTAAALALRTPGGVLPRPKEFVRPVDGIPTAKFGGFRVYNGTPRAGHGGLDLRAPVGTPVKAMCAGTVVLTGFHYFSGGAVYVDHGGGVLSAYFHLSKIEVKKGQKVNAGDVLALSGATGRVTGPHLHLSLYAGEAWLDALPLFGEAKIASGVEKVYEFK